VRAAGAATNTTGAGTAKEATCSSLLRAKLLPSTWRELRMCVGEMAVEEA